MKKIIDFSWYYLKSKIYPKRTADLARQLSENDKDFGKITLLSSEHVNQMIYTKIMDNKPFMIGRYGSTELVTMRNVEFALNNKIKSSMNQLNEWSGFFPNDIKYADKFVDTIRNASKECDIFGMWFNQFEEYFVKHYMNENVSCTYLFNLEPWTSSENPWSAALKGKKVLVIHPFSETIKSQYEKREMIFPGTDILPEFELKTLKAVQTIAGEQDERFADWFSALDFMYREALKIDFDVAIIGCGAYGFPLAAKLKKADKQTIHLAGATQLLFGIRGKRWDTVADKEYVRKFYNDAWVYPCEEDRPRNANKVEDGCYW